MAQHEFVQSTKSKGAKEEISKAVARCNQSRVSAIDKKKQLNKDTQIELLPFENTKAYYRILKIF